MPVGARTIETGRPGERSGTLERGLRLLQFFAAAGDFEGLQRAIVASDGFRRRFE